MTEAAFRTRQRIEANDTGSPAVYADAYYDGWRDDALAAISRSSPLVKAATLGVTDGTLEYPCPSDWITSSVEEETLTGDPVCRITTNTSGVLLFGSDYTVRGRTLVLAADPDYTGNWTHTYGGAWLITDLPADWVRIVLDFASAYAYDRRAADTAGYFSYDDGVEKVDRDAESAKWAKLRNERLARAEASLATIATFRSAHGTFDMFRA